MASFFGEIVTGSYRYIDDEDPDYTSEPAEDWTAGEGIEKETGLLVVTEGDQAGSYTRLWGDLPVVGSLQSGTRQIPVGRCAGYSLVHCPAGVQTAESDSLARAVLSTASTGCTVVVLTSRHVSDLKCDLASYLSTPVHCLATKAWTESLPCTRLPQPNIVSGLPAAIMTMAQMSGQQALLLMAFTEVLAVDSLALAPFTVCHKIGAVTKAGVKKVANIGAELSKLKVISCDDSLYM
eukprot:GFUD01005027.1.p2 GENE.GFUD01005027.1~~GFUD01005027.1.p2  ORF type:complete len:237 (-),score=82.82 GFUD01005027.1:390-1100(-)